MGLVVVLISMFEFGKRIMIRLGEYVLLKVTGGRLLWGS